MNSGDIEPITRDTNRYTSLTLSADGRTLATVLERSYATISILSKAGREFAQARTLLSQANEFNDEGSLSWSADGNLLINNTARLLKLGADGKNQTQLLADSGALIHTPSSCGTDYLVMNWQFHGVTNSDNIWRTDADGSSPLKLTDGKSDVSPVCSPDQKWVYYRDEPDNRISRVPLSGSGKTEKLLALPQDYFFAGGLSVSPDGTKLATAIEKRQEGRTREGTGRTREGTLRIAVFELASSSPPRMLDVSHYSGGVQFTPDGKSVAYVISENGVDNVWVQRLDGSAGHAITDFTSEHIWSFSLSPDGGSLAVLRGHWDSDVVLLQESKR